MKPLTIASALVLLMFLAGCDPLTSVTFVNETNQKLVFYTQYDARGALDGAAYVAAESSLDDGWIPAYYRWIRIASTREDGQWVFDHTYTRDEMEKAKRRIVVASLEPIPPPSDVKVYPPSKGSPPVLPSVSPGLAPAGSATPRQAVR